MKTTLVSIQPTKAAEEAGRYAMTPELLAATGARYSRNNEGLEVIAGKIEFGNEKDFIINIINSLGHYEKNIKLDEVMLVDELMGYKKSLRYSDLDKGVDSIFKMTDYGHASIMDMSPVAIFMDDISIFAAYYIWSLVPTAGGQESSTRYIKLSPEGLVNSDYLNFSNASQKQNWIEKNATAFAAYQKATDLWLNLGARRPELMRIPKSLLEDSSDKAKKQVERMRRNFAFDRARYFIPLSALTNMVLVMPARGWVALIQHLKCHALKELNEIGAALTTELNLATPRLIKHATESEATRPYFEATRSRLARDFEKLCEGASREANTLPEWTTEEGSLSSWKSNGYLDVFEPPQSNIQILDYSDALEGRANRYSLIGSDLARVSVRFGWEAVAIAEIRDLNRHRTGTKYCPLNPRGFYMAMDQCPEDETMILESLQELELFGHSATLNCRSKLYQRSPEYIYSALLGTQFPFEHTTQANHYIYETELRTGVGSHFRYAQHLRETLKIWYEKMPQTRGLVLEGSAEPE